MKKLWKTDLPIWLNVVHLICRAVQLAVIVFFGYNLYLTISIGQTPKNPMLYFFAFIIPGQVYNRFAIRNGLKANKQALKEHENIFLRSLLIAILITALFITVCVVYFIYRTK